MSCVMFSKIADTYWLVPCGDLQIIRIFHYEGGVMVLWGWSKCDGKLKARLGKGLYKIKVLLGPLNYLQSTSIYKTRTSVVLVISPLFQNGITLGINLV